MPLYIKDETTTRLVNELARQRGVTKQAAVRLAVQAELRREAAAVPIRERLAALWATHKLPPRTGKAADKAFFDDLSGEP
jgi:antitoxin VapB